jgi:hypothetical protein
VCQPFRDKRTITVGQSRLIFWRHDPSAEHIKGLGEELPVFPHFQITLEMRKIDPPLGDAVVVAFDAALLNELNRRVYVKRID